MDILLYTLSFLECKCTYVWYSVGIHHTPYHIQRVIFWMFECLKLEWSTPNSYSYDSLIPTMWHLLIFPILFFVDGFSVKFDPNCVSVISKLVLIRKLGAGNLSCVYTVWVYYMRREKKSHRRNNRPQKYELQTKEWDLRFYCHGLQCIITKEMRKKNIICVHWESWCKSVPYWRNQTTHRKISVIFSFITTKFTFDIIYSIWSTCFFLPYTPPNALLSEHCKKKTRNNMVENTRKRMNENPPSIFTGICFFCSLVALGSLWLVRTLFAVILKRAVLTALASFPRVQTKTLACKAVWLCKKCST